MLKDASPTEKVVLGIIWNSGELLTTKQINTIGAEHGWSTQTLTSLIGKLIDKGYLEPVKYPHKPLVYKPLFTEEQVKVMQTRRFRESVHNGSVRSLITSLLADENITPEDVRTIRQLTQDLFP